MPRAGVPVLRHHRGTGLPREGRIWASIRGIVGPAREASLGAPRISDPLSALRANVDRNDQDSEAAANYPTIMLDRIRRSGPSASLASPVAGSRRNRSPKSECPAARVNRLATGSRSGATVASGLGLVKKKYSGISTGYASVRLATARRQLIIGSASILH